MWQKEVQPERTVGEERQSPLSDRKPRRSDQDSTGDHPDDLLKDVVLVPNAKERESHRAVVVDGENVTQDPVFQAPASVSPPAPTPPPASASAPGLASTPASTPGLAPGPVFSFIRPSLIPNATVGSFNQVQDKTEETKTKPMLRPTPPQSDLPGALLPAPAPPIQIAGTEGKKPKETAASRSLLEETKQKELPSAVKIPVVEPSVQLRTRLEQQLRAEPAKAQAIIDKEAATFGRKLIALQIEQQTLLVKRRDMQQELERQKLEIEHTNKQLAEVIRQEKYTEADMLQQRITKLSEIVSSTQETCRLAARMMSMARCRSSSSQVSIANRSYRRARLSSLSSPTTSSRRGL